MNIEALLKRGKSQGSDDIVYVLAQAIYDLQQKVKKLEKQLAETAETARDARLLGPAKIGGEW